VVWVRHSDEDLVAGTPDWQIVEPLVPRLQEVVVEKHFGDAFEGTDLHRVFSGLGIVRLVVCGLQSDGCVLATLFDGFVRGYDVVLVGDAHTTNDRAEHGVSTPVEDIIGLVNFVWAHRLAPGRLAAAVDTETVFV
jgi:nicotinamidase-related amidase